MYIVQTCMHMFKFYVRVLNQVNMYIQCTNLFIKYCVARVQCTDRDIHFMKCTDIAELGMYIDISFLLQLAWLAGL